MGIFRAAFYGMVFLSLTLSVLGCEDANPCATEGGCQLECINQADCDNNQTCLNEGICACFAFQNGATCTDSSDCDSGEICSDACQCVPLPNTP